MNKNKEILNEELFVELNCNEDLEICGGTSSLFKRVCETADNVLCTIVEKLFG